MKKGENEVKMVKFVFCFQVKEKNSKILWDKKDYFGHNHYCRSTYICDR